MSDMYLELRSRIPLVAAKTQLGTERIQNAQDAVGLSNEAIAREIPISEKTWRRWKEAGEIPTRDLPAVAKILRLEIRGAAPEPFDLPPNGTQLGPLEPAVRQMVQEEVSASLERIEAMLERLLRDDSESTRVDSGP